MKKIIFFAKNLEIGGMERALVTLINSIDYNEYKVTLVLERYEGKLSEQINKNIKIIDYNLSTNKNVFLRKIINGTKKVLFALKNYRKYDCAINYATYSVWGSQMALICSTNNVIYIHSDYYNVFNQNTTKIKDFFKSIFINKFKKIVFVSTQSRNNILKIMPDLKEKSIVLGNLIDSQNIIEESNRYEANIDNNKANIVLVARLDETSKNISQLINKINNSDEVEKFNLYIIGNGPDEKTYKEQAKTKNIIFLGELENPYPYIKACDYLILTSRYEGFPVVYNEATVLGTPIITTIPVEDEQIKYDKFNIIELDKDLKNFDEIINNLTKKDKSTKVKKIDFNKINELKLRKFYETVVEKLVKVI